MQRERSLQSVTEISYQVAARHSGARINVPTFYEVLMPIYQLENIPEEFVTPKHSRAYGRLITGTQVEVGLLRYKAGEGAKEHAHPHEQILLVLSGKCRLTLDGKPTIIGSGMAALIPSNTPHALEVLEDTEVVSCKGVIGGVGHRIA
jgi:quercetin dioxygenase-like cupin family protein